MRYSKVQYLCWLFSGAEISLLKECPTDFNRQASIGFTILMTCLFGGLAGGFAASKFSGGALLPTLVFGIVWAALIFSIDRSMVVTLKKNPEQKKQAFWIPFVARAVLAGLLAFMISIPLEIYIFQDEIGMQLQIDDANKANNQQTKREKQLGLHGEQQEQTQAETERTRQENLANSEPQDAAYQLLKQQAHEKQGEAGQKRKKANEIPLDKLKSKIPTYPRSWPDGTTRTPGLLAGPAYQAWTEAGSNKAQLQREPIMRMGYDANCSFKCQV